MNPSSNGFLKRYLSDITTKKRNFYFYCTRVPIGCIIRKIFSVSRFAKLRIFLLSYNYISVSLYMAHFYSLALYQVFWVLMRFLRNLLERFMTKQPGPGHTSLFFSWFVAVKIDKLMMVKVNFNYETLYS